MKIIIWRKLPGLPAEEVELDRSFVDKLGASHDTCFINRSNVILYDSRVNSRPENFNAYLHGRVFYGPIYIVGCDDGRFYSTDITKSDLEGFAPVFLYRQKSRTEIIAEFEEHFSHEKAIT